MLENIGMTKQIKLHCCGSLPNERGYSENDLSSGTDISQSLNQHSFFSFSLNTPQYARRGHLPQ